MSLVPIIPQPPDFYVCDRAYGDMILANDCTSAINQLPDGHESVQYYPNRPNVEYHLPFSITRGTCTVIIEHAGPDLGAPPVIDLVPDDLKRMAEFVKGRCAVHGIGGFTTDGFDSAINYIETTEERDMELRPEQPSNMWFVTVSITGSSKGIMKPGDTDPVVAYVLKDQVEFFLNVHSDDAASRAHFSATLQRLVIRSWQMKRGGSLDWWDPRDTPSNDMTYTCDADLGSPALVDCAQIQWQDLGSPSDTITVGPDVTKFLSQNTCNLAISATKALTLTWSQIRAALSTLINTCIETPMQSPQGGRAYFGAYHALSRRGVKARRDVTGLDALPPHANLTIFASASNAPSALDCEWQAAQGERPVSSCK